MTSEHPGWGGARPNTGGRREGAGRMRQRISLSLEAARVLREIVRQRNAQHPEARYTPDNVIDDLIYAEAHELGIRHASDLPDD